MNDVTPFVPDDQVAMALGRVHGHIRRRRRRIRTGASAVVALGLVVGLGLATQDPKNTRPEAPMSIGDGAAPTNTPWTSCGPSPVSSEGFDLELTIDGPDEWSAGMTGASAYVVVVAANLGSDPLTISFPGGVGIIGIAGDEVVTEPSGSVLMSSTRTLEPGEVVELPGWFPVRACSGDTLGEGTRTLAPIVTIERDGDPPVVVRGAALSVAYR